MPRSFWLFLGSIWLTVECQVHFKVLVLIWRSLCLGTCGTSAHLQLPDIASSALLIGGGLQKSLRVSSVLGSSLWNSSSFVTSRPVQFGIVCFPQEDPSFHSRIPLGSSVVLGTLMRFYKEALYKFIITLRYINNSNNNNNILDKESAELNKYAQKN